MACGITPRERSFAPREGHCSSPRRSPGQWRLGAPPAPIQLAQGHARLEVGRVVARIPLDRLRLRLDRILETNHRGRAFAKVTERTEPDGRDGCCAERG